MPTNQTPEVCETCKGTGVYHTGAFVGDGVWEDLKPIMAYCPDCPRGLARAEGREVGVDTLCE